MGPGRRRPLLPALLPLLPLPLLLLPPAAWGNCGPLPHISHAEPPGDTKDQESFSVGTTVTYRCLAGYVKRPLLSDTMQCLPNSQWSNLPEFCGRSCSSPPRVLFARISQEDEMKNFYAVDTTVKYTCRAGFESTTAQLPTSTCFDNLTWSEVPELCQRKSCGIPANPEHGKVITNDHLFGARAEVVCNHGYTLKGASPLIRCSLRGTEVAWSQLPACQAISCPPPPAIPHGKHNGNGTEEFVYNSVVMYTCDPGLQLVGNETLRCTVENGVDGVWSNSPPTCRVTTTAATNPTEPSGEKRAGSLYGLASIPVVLAVFAVGVIVMTRKNNKKHSYNMHLQKHEPKGRAPPIHPKIMDDEKQSVPWHSYFCHTTSCHVCPGCEERLHAAVDPRAEPARRRCAACEDWLRARPGTPRTYSVPSIGGEESRSPAGTSSPAEAADVLRGHGAGEAVPERREAEQPMDHERETERTSSTVLLHSGHHVCPVCESWLRAHLGHCESGPAAPGERPGGPQRQDEGPRGPVCPPCADRLHLSLVHSDAAGCPVCPLAGEGTLAHLVPHRSPGCHVCPVCAAPTHEHLCQPRRQAPDG